mgnify:CR=1 FL=1
MEASSAIASEPVGCGCGGLGIGWLGRVAGCCNEKSRSIIVETNFLTTVEGSDGMGKSSMAAIMSRPERSMILSVIA